MCVCVCVVLLANLTLRFPLYFPLPSPSPSPIQTELNEYYYYWKQSAVGRSSRTYRRQSKQKHIRLWKQMGKPHPPVNEREMGE